MRVSFQFQFVILMLDQMKDFTYFTISSLPETNRPYTAYCTGNNSVTFYAMSLCLTSGRISSRVTKSGISSRPTVSILVLFLVYI